MLGAVRDNRGIIPLVGADFPAELAALRATLGDLPVLMAGMVGAARGWMAVDYVPCPADLSALARGIHWVEPGRTGIVPGVSTLAGGRGDTMRSEEIQLLGAHAAGLIPDDALVCQPGTHCKWAWMAGGKLADFTTRMTGELFALLRQHSLLAEMVGGDALPGAAFDAGVADAANDDLIRDLFGIRAADLLGLRRRGDGASYLSGLLIGSDIRAQRLAPDTLVHLVAEAPLAALYARAIAAAGGRTQPIDTGVAFIAGMAALWRIVDPREGG